MREQKARQKRETQPHQKIAQGSFQKDRKRDKRLFFLHTHTQAGGKIFSESVRKEPLFLFQERRASPMNRQEVRVFFKNLRKYVFRPYIKMFLMHAIVFYQKNFSKKTCLYRPTCSQYMLEAINNHGVIVGILLGSWRLLRCNPFSKGGYDPVPENYFKVRWLY